MGVSITRSLAIRDTKNRCSTWTSFPSKIIGSFAAFFQDITKPALHKEAMIEKAQEVIKKNLQTVQQIASMPGENAVESEVILNSIIQSVTTQEVV